MMFVLINPYNFQRPWHLFKVRVVSKNWNRRYYFSVSFSDQVQRQIESRFIMTFFLFFFFLILESVRLSQCLSLSASSLWSLSARIVHTLALFFSSNVGNNLLFVSASIRLSQWVISQLSGSFDLLRDNEVNFYAGSWHTILR